MSVRLSNVSVKRIVCLKCLNEFVFLASGDRKRPSNEDMGDLVGEKRSGLDGSLNEGLRVPVDLIVLNLSFKTDEEALKKFFEQYGEVQYVEVCSDRLLFLCPFESMHTNVCEGGTFPFIITSTFNVILPLMEQNFHRILGFFL